MRCSKARATCCTTASISNIARSRSSATTRRTTAIASGMNVTHLECSLTGERHEPGQLHNLAARGTAARPLRSRSGERH